MEGANKRFLEPPKPYRLATYTLLLPSLSFPYVKYGHPEIFPGTFNFLFHLSFSLSLHVAK